MKLAYGLALALLALAALPARAEEEEITPYGVPEIENFLKVFKQTYNNAKQPEEDAIAVLADLRKAYRYLEARGEERTKEEEKAQDKILSTISKGLNARRRELVTLECARVLGEIGAEQGGKALAKWMDRTVLDAKSPNPQWVEYGFLSLAWIGGEDKAAMDLLEDYATGKHVDIGVATQALRAAYEWRALSGKTRKDIFEKVVGYLGGLWSNSRGGDPKKRGTYEKRYKAVSEEGLKALNELSGAEKPFVNPEEALEWWQENKRRRWDDYTGPRFRGKAAEGKPAAEEKPEGEAPADEEEGAEGVG